jgi:hypothetical protein
LVGNPNYFSGIQKQRNAAKITVRREPTPDDYPDQPCQFMIIFAADVATINVQLVSVKPVDILMGILSNRHAMASSGWISDQFNFVKSVVNRSDSKSAPIGKMQTIKHVY